MRVFFKGASIIEITNQANRYKTGTYDLTIVPGNYIYISTDFPMNHFFLKLGDTLNAISSTMKIEYWDGRVWVEVVHINDYTNSFSNSGFIDFTPDRDESWAMDNTSDKGNNGITGLETITVYDQYWTRISFSNALTPSLSINYIGNMFSDDIDLFSEFPLFNDANFLTCFESLKLDWEEQHVKAAELIIQELIRKNIIIGPEQILDRNILMPASVCKVAEIIFNAFGKDYIDQLNRAKEEYAKRINLSKYLVDTNNNAIKDAKENELGQGWLSR